MTKAMRLLGAVLGVTLLATACGDDKSTSTSATTSLSSSIPATTVAASGGPATGSTVKIGVISTVQSPTIGFPEIETVAKATVQYLNAHGGANNHKMELVICNDKFDSNEAAACARQMVDQGVVAVVAPIATFGGSILPILEPAKISYITRPYSGPDWTSPVSFALANTQVTGTAMGSGLAKSGCKSVASINSGVASGVTFSESIAKGAESGGAKSVGAFQVVQGGSTDGSATVASMLSKGADCVGFAVPTADATKIVTAGSQSGQKLRYAGSHATFTSKAISQLGSPMEGAIVLSSDIDVADTDVPEFSQLQEAMKTANVPQDHQSAGFTVTTWGMLAIVKTAVSKVPGDVNAASVLQSMSSLTDVGTKVFGQLDYTKPGAISAYPRVFQTFALVYDVKDGKLVNRRTVDVKALMAAG